MKRLGGVAALLGLAAAIIGVWFFVKERSFASEHGNELAETLQWVGAAIALLGAAVFLIGLVVGYSEHE